VIDVALYEAVFNCMESLLPEYSAFGAVREAGRLALPGIAPSNAYPCTDGWVLVAGNGDSIFKRLMKAIGRDDWADPALAGNAGPRGARRRDRCRHRRLDRARARSTSAGRAQSAAGAGRPHLHRERHRRRPALPRARHDRAGHDSADGDVSAEVALQLEREQMIAKLQHSREWLATAISAGRIALWERDLVARTLVLGGRWAEIIGTTPQAFGPVTEQSFIDLCHPDDLPGATERFVAYLKDPSEPYADEFRIKHARDGWTWVLSRGKVAERSSDGHARRVVGTYVDISDLKVAQAAHELQQAAEQASAMKSQFLRRCWPTRSRKRCPTRTATSACPRPACRAACARR
jgi:PAS domain-containing protein